MSFNVAALASRLFRRYTKKTTTAPRNAARFRPVLECFEDRTVPAALTWTNGFGNNDFYTPANWYVTGTTTVPTNAPMAGDDVTFDGLVSSADCNDLGVLVLVSGGGGTITPGPGTTGLNSLNLINGYAGTVSVVAPLSVITLNLKAGSAGAIAQPATSVGSDITITGAFTWNSGTLNSSSHLANVNITGSTATALFQPTNGGTVDLGSTINLEDGAVATMKEGTISATNDGIEFNIDAGGMLADPGAGASAGFSKGGNVTVGGQININGDQSWFKVYSGTLSSDIPLKNSGGSLILMPETLTTIQGEVDGDPDGPSVRQTAGVMYLYQGSILEVNPNVDFGLIMSGGALSIQLDQGSGPAEIVGTVKITGGDIVSGANSSGDTHLFGMLKVEGDVVWTGGTYRPYLNAEASWNSDVWRVTGTFEIGGTAALAPIAVDGENNPVAPASNMQWTLFLAGGFDTVQLPANFVDGDVWAIDPVNNPANEWDLRRK